VRRAGELQVRAPDPLRELDAALEVPGGKWQPHVITPVRRQLR